MKNLYNQTTKIILLCLLAQAFNLLVAYILGDILHLPLFMDTVGTVFIVFYAGLVPGMMVGISYNILRFFLMMILGNPVYPWEIMYCLCGAAIAFFTCFFFSPSSLHALLINTFKLFINFLYSLIRFFWRNINI